MTTLRIAYGCNIHLNPLLTVTRMAPWESDELVQLIALTTPNNSRVFSDGKNTLAGAIVTCLTKGQMNHNGASCIITESCT